MAVGQVNGTFWYNSAPQNGALAKLWKKAGFYTSVNSGDTVQDNPLTATATVVNVTNGALFAVGNVIQMQLEYAYVISIAVNALTIQRGYDNTTPASHVQTTVIYKLTLDPPAEDDAEPAAGYQQGANVTTAVAYGGDGAYRWTDVPDGEYFVSVYYDGHRGWLYQEVESRFTPNSVLKIQGDILFRGATDLQRLPKGASGTILQMGANEPSWAANSPVLSGLILMWAGFIADIPAGFVICDGNNSTPNYLNRFIKSVPTAATNPGTTGGATSRSLGTSGTGGDGTPGANIFVSAGRLRAAGGAGSVATVTDTITDIRPLWIEGAFLMKT